MSKPRSPVDQQEFVSLCWLSGMTVSSTEEHLYRKYGKEAVPLFVRMLWQLRFDQLRRADKGNIAIGPKQGGVSP
jgi:hypothetical protein